MLSVLKALWIFLREIKAPVRGKVEKCAVGKLKLAVKKGFIVSKAAADFSFALDDAKRIQGGEDEDEGEGRKMKERVEVEEKVGSFAAREARIGARVIELRMPPHAAALRMQSGARQYFRQFLADSGLNEIHSPKLAAGSSEGGKDALALDCMTRTAFPAQLPQFCKQMAISGGMKLVFEIGSV